MRNYRVPPDEATLLLEAAKQHCPEAIADIEYGLKLSRTFALFR
jgi:hypothetical protein